MNKRLLSDRLRSFLIILLTLTAILMMIRLFFGFTEDMPKSFSELFGHGEPVIPRDESGEGYVQGAKPLAIAVTDGSGLRRGERYSDSAVSGLYERYSAALAEALGSAGEPEKVELSEWERALSGQGVYFDFIYSQPLRALAAWLGSEMSGGAASHTAGRLCLAQEAEGVYLYYIRARDGLAYRCETMSSLNTELTDGGNGALFAFEAGYSEQELDPYTLFVGELPQLSELSGEDTLYFSALPEELMSAFGMNSYVALPYSEADGTVVYVDGDTTLRLEPDGRAIFRQTGAEQLRIPAEGERPRMEEIIDAAFRLVDEATGDSRGDAELTLSSVEYSDVTSSYELHFEYLVYGLIVRQADGGSAARVTASAGYLTEADIVLREYKAQGEAYPVMPEKQAAAMLVSSGGGEPMLCYLDNGERVTPGWIAFER